MDLSKLNDPQRQAVEHGDGPLLVLAGAGSGKTRVITYRIAHLLGQGVSPKAVLALTFTNKAAGEMRERARALCGASADKVFIGTFHALGLMLLSEGRRRGSFTIYDAADQLGVVREILRHHKDGDRRFDPKALLFRISRWKSGFVSPEALEARPDLLRDEYDEAAAGIYPRYETALRGFSAYDFDDLVGVPVREPQPAWPIRWRYLLVDEYQDTNDAQLRLIRLLGEKQRNVCVVGDDDQSIYGWRGAQVGNILAFERDFPGARVIKLEENYRSRPAILKAATALIAHAARRHEKTLWTRRAAGPAPRLVIVDDPEAEARFVTTEIGALGLPPGDIAVLYRSNVQARPLEDALREAGLPYRVIGGQEFYERKEVKDVLAYLRVALHPSDEIALRRIVNYPARGIGPATLERAAASGMTLLSGLAEHAPAFVAIVTRLRERLAAGDAAAAVRALCEEIKLYEDLHDAAPSAQAAQRRIGHVKDLISSLEGRADVKKYIQLLSLRSREEEAAPEDAVTLTTLHGAKGLEFPVVFLVGLEEGLLPHARTLHPIATDVLDSSGDLDEERRLLYVGITRAKERLYLSRARMRQQHGRARPVTASRFCEEIPADLLETEERADDGAVAEACMAKLRALMES